MSDVDPNVNACCDELLSKYRKTLELDPLKWRVLQEVDRGIDKKHQGLGGLIHFAICLDEVKQDEERRDIIKAILDELLEQVAQEGKISDVFMEIWGKYQDKKETMRKFFNFESMDDDPRVQKYSKERADFMDKKYLEFLKGFKRTIEYKAKTRPVGNGRDMLENLADKLEEFYGGYTGHLAFLYFEDYLKTEAKEYDCKRDGESKKGLIIVENLLREFQKEEKEFWVTIQPQYEEIGCQDQESHISSITYPVISYFDAKYKIQALFPYVTDKEIAIWVYYGAMRLGTAEKFITPRNAHGVPVNFGSIESGDDGDDDFRIASMLVHLYFSEHELQEADPERWLTYPQLSELVLRTGVSQPDLMAKILTYLGNSDIYDPSKWNSKHINIQDPISRNRHEIEVVNKRDKLKTAMYRAGWILEAFPRVDLGRFRKVEAFNEMAAGESKPREREADESQRSDWAYSQVLGDFFVCFKRDKETTTEDAGRKDIFRSMARDMEDIRLRHKYSGACGEVIQICQYLREKIQKYEAKDDDRRREIYNAVLGGLENIMGEHSKSNALLADWRKTTAGVRASATAIATEDAGMAEPDGAGGADDQESEAGSGEQAKALEAHAVETAPLAGEGLGVDSFRGNDQGEAIANNDVSNTPTVQNENLTFEDFFTLKRAKVIWCAPVRTIALQFFNQHGRLPDVEVVWDGLRSQPPAGYTITPGGRESIHMTGQTLTLADLRKHWRNWTKSKPKPQNKQSIK